MSIDSQRARQDTDKQAGDVIASPACFKLHLNAMKRMV